MTLDWQFSRLFLFLSKEISIRGYMSLWRDIKLSDIFLGKIEVWEANHKILGSYSMFKPLNCRVWLDWFILCLKQLLLKRVNSGQISLVVTCTTGCTCHHEVTLHRNQWKNSERKRLNTSWNVCVSSDQWRTVVPIIGSCEKGVRHHGLGAAGTLPLSLFDSGWQAHVDSHLADSVVRAEISNNT